ncbi:MAG: 4-(cytidine 5'-diphospho)-2-C-methyl-D-erythritol kinase [Thermoleophilaceae bacterium]
MIHERAHAKVNLVLHVGRPRADGMHPLCSLFSSIDLADDVVVAPAERDEVSCAGVGPGNLAERALAEFREEVGQAAGAMSVRIEKRIPIAAGLGGGSADAAAVLRAANALAGEPLDLEGLRALATRLGSDVPGQLRPGHALVTGTGELVEAVRLPPLALVLLPGHGLSTAAVYAELDRLGAGRDELDPEPLRLLATGTLPELAAGIENDLERASLSLRPDRQAALGRLREAGALGAAISGSGPTAFGLFRSSPEAARAASEIEGALVAHAHEAS